MRKILISACLLGAPVRYHGGHARSSHALLDRWAAEGRLVPVCPEVLGGLPTPRPAAERQGGQSRFPIVVHDRNGLDVSGEFQRGAEAAAAAARAHDVALAILKEGSPSCATTSIHDGTFSGRRIEGRGVTAETLAARGIKLFSEHEIAAAAEYLAACEGEADTRREAPDSSVP